MFSVRFVQAERKLRGRKKTEEAFSDDAVHQISREEYLLTWTKRQIIGTHKTSPSSFTFINYEIYFMDWKLNIAAIKT